MTNNTKHISPLRQRMIEDMTMRKLSPRTQTAYIRVSVITIIDVVMFTLFDGVSGDAERAGGDRAPCLSWC